MDFAGAAVYLDSQVDAFAADLKRGVYGNPHSGGAAGDAASDAVEQVRFRSVRRSSVRPSGLVHVPDASGHASLHKSLPCVTCESACFTRN